MDLEQVITCPGNREKCAPLRIFNKTILQHTLRFTEVDECFKSFRLVCKTWKEAVETIRFNRVVDNNFFIKLYHTLANSIFYHRTRFLPAITTYHEKYLKSFRKLEVRVDIFWELEPFIFELISNSAQNMNELHFFLCGSGVSERQKSFIAKMLNNSAQILKVITVWTISPILDISFSKLKILKLYICEDFIKPIEFQTHFPELLQNMKNLETVKLRFHSKVPEVICQYIAQNYAEHCISTKNESDMLDHTKVKIFESSFLPLTSLKNKKYIGSLEYMSLVIKCEKPMDFGWDNYRDCFDQCTNLKAIELMPIPTDDRETLTNILPNLQEFDQEIWKERISYFKSRGIRLADRGEIDENENLRVTLAKKVGISWKFHLYG
jgi:hypothetical protein